MRTTDVNAHDPPATRFRRGHHPALAAAGVSGA